MKAVSYYFNQIKKTLLQHKQTGRQTLFSKPKIGHFSLHIPFFICLYLENKSASSSSSLNEIDSESSKFLFQSNRENFITA